jgi:hypothetical protein
MILLLDYLFQSDIGLEINPQQIFELAMKGRYGIANERIINSLKESIKKNDVFEKVKIDKIYKDDLKKSSFYLQNRPLQECHLYFLFLYLVVQI